MGESIHDLTKPTESTISKDPESLTNPLVDPDCPDGDCGPADPEPSTEVADPRTDAEQDKSLCVAICTLCAAVPALVGSCCWPILVGAMFAVAAGNVNGGLVKFFHGVQVAIMLMLMTNIIQFAYWSSKRVRRGKGHWHMYRPVYLITLATPMVLLQPTCMLVIGSWICDGAFSADQLNDGVTACTSWNNPANCTGSYLPNGVFNLTSAVSIASGVSYVDGCSDSMKNFFFDGGQNSNALTPNTVVGWCIQIFGTYLGFIVMGVGVCQATLLHVKIMNKWRAIRQSA